MSNNSEILCQNISFATQFTGKIGGGCDLLSVSPVPFGGSLAAGPAPFTALTASLPEKASVDERKRC